MIYRILCRFNDLFALLVFGAYLVAFVLAFVMVFLFPPGALLLVLLGVAGFVAVWAMVLISRGIERAVARAGLGAGRCPTCGGGVERESAPDPTVPGEPDTILVCPACAGAWEDGGRRYLQPAEDEEDLDTYLEEPAL